MKKTTLDMFQNVTLFKIHLPEPGFAAQVVEHLPSKCEAPSSNPSTDKKKKSKKTQNNIYLMFLKPLTPESVV
jgi:hypothetical protein